MVRISAPISCVKSCLLAAAVRVSRNLSEMIRTSEYIGKSKASLFSSLTVALFSKKTLIDIWVQRPTWSGDAIFKLNLPVRVHLCMSN